MSLPLSDIVQVDISVSPTLAPLAGFGELLFFTSEAKVLEKISLAERARLFGSLKEVQDSLPGATETIKAATSFFSQTPQPSMFTVGVTAQADYKSALTSGVLDAAAVVAAMGTTEHKFKIQIDNDASEKEVSVTLAATDSTLEKIAAKVKTGLDAAYTTNKPSCVVSGDRLVIQGWTAGSAGKMSFASAGASNDCSRILKLTVADGAVRTDGGAAEDFNFALSACLDARNSFVAVATESKMRDTTTPNKSVGDIAGWCEANKKLFMNTTNDVKVMDSATAATTVAASLQAKAYRYTITTFGIDSEEYPSVSLFARIATVNYEGTNTAITLKFKQLPGITALNLKASQKSAMDKINVGGFMNFGGQLMYAESRMADGGWMDAVHGLMWLEDRIRKGVFNLMYGSTTKIPATDTGVNMVVQRVASALQQGVTNGLLGPGMTPEGEFLANGWKITAKSIVDCAPEDKSNRIYRGLTFQCVGAGALHNVIITGSFNE